MALPAALFSFPILCPIGMCITQAQLNRLWKYGSEPEEKKRKRKQ
jgi:hypothetical protein